MDPKEPAELDLKWNMKRYLKLGFNWRTVSNDPTDCPTTKSNKLYTNQFDLKLCFNPNQQPINVKKHMD